MAHGEGADPAQHTPGPWQITQAARAPTEQKGDYLIHTADGLHVAEAFQYQADSVKNGPAEANAKLIAQAPNLLAALKVVMTAIGTYVPPSSRGQWGDAMEQARAAIEAAS